MTDFGRLLRVLVEGQVDFIVIGGVAAAVHGSARNTQDLDVVYSRQLENLKRLVAALKPLSPYLRGAPPGLPFAWAEETLRRGLNFTLTTSLGAFDILGEASGAGGYAELLPHVIRAKAFELEFPCLGLDKLIEVKRAAGRPKDFEAIAELEALREERDRT
ncbi:MAG TPA: hypothetical protein VF310_11245 [Vicinamibacteria bacterium]